MRQALLIVNGASGSADAISRDQIGDCLAKNSWTIGTTFDCREDQIPNASSLAGTNTELVIILGGDGTLHSILPRFEKWTGAVLTLPGGTTNLLCHELYNEGEVESALELFCQGKLVTRRRNCIRWDDEIALTEVLAGPGARWSEVREEMRDADIGSAIGTAMDIIGEGISGPGMLVTDPAQGREDGYAGVRLIPGATGIAIEGYGLDEIGEILSQGTAILRRNFREGPHDDLVGAPEVALESADGEPMALMVDGERRECGPQMRFSLAPFELDLLGLPND